MARGRSYPPEFRAEAVRLYRMGGRTYEATAAEIGISAWTLSRWVQQAEIDEGSKAGNTTNESEELRRLRHENKILKEEKEILRKATLFFTRETDQRR